MGNFWSNRGNNPREDERNDDRMDINLLLVGAIGTGKSSTGNTLLQLKSNPFKAIGNDDTTTRKFQADYSRFNGKVIKIVDMPGLDNKATEKEVAEAAINAMADTDKGYDAFLLVIKFGKQGEVTKTSTDHLKKMFGRDVFKKYGILVVTHGDNFKGQEQNQTIDEYCSQQTGYTHELWEECQHRVVLLDNCNKDPEKIDLDAQRKMFFAVVEEMRNKPRYKPSMFPDAKIKNNEIQSCPDSEYLKETIRLIMYDLGNIDVDNPGSAQELSKMESNAQLQKNNVLRMLPQGHKRERLLNLTQNLIQAVQMKQGLIDKINQYREREEDKDWPLQKEDLDKKMKETEENLDKDYINTLI